MCADVIDDVAVPPQFARAPDWQTLPSSEPRQYQGSQM